MHLLLKRDEPLANKATFPARLTTFGVLFVDGEPECRTLEDGVLEDPLERVENWKIPGLSAIPAGVYDISLEDSPKFGHDTITLNNVPGYSYVRVHSGEDIDDTEGCIIVGDRVDEKNFKISGGKVRGVLAKLKAKVQDAIRGRHERVTIEIINPELA